MATDTPEGLMFNGEELAGIVSHLDVAVSAVKFTVVKKDDLLGFYRPWLDDYGVDTYALTIDHEYDEESDFSNSDYWQDIFAKYVEENYPDACIDADGWLPNVIFHV